MINALTNLLYTLFKSNTNWTHVEFDSTTMACLSHLSKLATNLINSLVITTLRPNLAHNRTYFDLIEKLKSIKAYIEPLSAVRRPADDIKTPGDDDFWMVASCIDTFRDDIDNNLNLFFGKTHLRSVCFVQRHKITYLNPHITQMRLIKRCLLVPADRVMSRRLLLGHLISRNLLQVLVNFFARLNDYMAFYLCVKSMSADSLALDALLDLIEPSLFVVKVYILNLAEPNKAAPNFLAVMVKFYALFNQALTPTTRTSKSSAKRTIKQNHAEKCGVRLQASLSRRCKLIAAYLNEIFLAVTDRAVLFNELARFCLDAPFYLAHGLGLINNLLKSVSDHDVVFYLNVRI